MMKNSFKLFAGIILLLAQLSAFATEGNLFKVVSSGTPALVDITLCLNGKAKLSCEDEKVTALDLSIYTTVDRMYPEAGIFVNTPGYSIASLGIACSMYDPSGYCIFGVSSTSPASISLVNNNVKSPRFAYIGNFENNLFNRCPVNSDGSLGACATITVSEISYLYYPLDFAFNSAGTIVYIANYSGNILKCDVDSTSGAFSGCGVAYAGIGVIAEGVTLDDSGTHLYIGLYDGYPMTVCDVDQSTGALTCPTPSMSAPVFNYAMNVLFNSAGDIAYIGNWDNDYMYWCHVDPVSGNFTDSVCATTPTGPFTSLNYPLAQPSGIAFNPGKSIIYAANYNYNLSATPPVAPVSKCVVNGDHSLTCTNTGDNYSNFLDPIGIAVNEAGTFAYVTNNVSPFNSSLGSVTYCQVNSTSGELYNCQPTAMTSSPQLLYGVFGIKLLY